MPESLENEKVHELAGGWITERAGTRVPLFLKLAYVGFSAFGVAYLFLYRTGETGHPTRGPQVVELNKALDPVNGGVIALIAALLIAFIAGLFWIAFRRGGDED